MLGLTDWANQYLFQLWSALTVTFCTLIGLALVLAFIGVCFSIATNEIALWREVHRND